MNRFQRFKIINRDAVKYIAIFFMFWGHLFAWRILWGQPDIADPMSVLPLWQQLFCHLSLLCPPIMFFMVGDGYKYSRDRKKYALRLFIFAAVTQLIQCLIEKGWDSANVIFAMLFGLLEIAIYESKLKKWQKVILIALMILLGILITCEWMIFGELLILALHIFRDSPKKRLIAYTSLVFVWQLIAVFFNPLFDCIARFLVVMAAYALMTVFYSGKKGRFPKFSKWFFYIFYPAHYLIIYAVYLKTK